MLDKKTFEENITKCLNNTIYETRGDVFLVNNHYVIAIAKVVNDCRRPFIAEDITRLKELLLPASAKFFSCTFECAIFISTICIV